jgi:hypothetical protein
MSGHMSWLRRRVLHRAPTNKTDKANFTVPSPVSLGASSAAPLPLRLLSWIPDKLALSGSLAAPLTTVPLVGTGQPGWNYNNQQPGGMTPDVLLPRARVRFVHVPMGERRHRVGRRRVQAPRRWRDAVPGPDVGAP